MARPYHDLIPNDYPTKPGFRYRKRGVVLYIVVTIVLLVTLITYGLLIAMRDQNLAAAVSGDRLQARQAAFSARDVLLSMLEESRQSRGSYGGIDLNPVVFSNIRLAGRESTSDDSLPFGVVVHPDRETLQFGAVNESGKIHLGALLEADQRLPGWGRATLMRLPDMTESVADHILDWIDEDDQPRDFGNESRFYLEEFGIPARNGLPPIIDECDWVSEVTRQPFSELGNGRQARTNSPRRGRNESARQSTNRDSPGWVNYLTVFSAERNESYTGNARIDLNQPDLFSLHQALVENLDLEMANFVILYRQHGPAESTTGNGSKAFLRSPTDLTIDFTIAGARELDSLLDLVNATIEIRESQARIVRIKSPIQVEAANLIEKLPKIMDFCTITKRKMLSGRVNINIAPREVLLSVPGIDESVADRIIAIRTASAIERHDVSWLLTERVLSLDTFRELAPFITAGGDVYRAQFAGFADHQTAPYVFEAVLDAAGPTPKQAGFLRMNETFEILQMLGSSQASTTQ